MKYGFLPKIMFRGYKTSFKKELKLTLNVDNPKLIMKKAHKKYIEIVKSIDEFNKNDRFITNILSCALLSSILLSLDKEYSVEEIRTYYKNAMCKNKLTQFACKGNKKYTIKGRNKLKMQAELSKKIDNPYSWKFDVEDGETINIYTAYFHTCGICYLMKKLNLSKYIPAMCTLDYDMARLNNSKFTRKYTLAENGPYCDCHYEHQD